jgi:hypothetical protein
MDRVITFGKWVVGIWLPAAFLIVGIKLVDYFMELGIVAGLLAVTLFVAIIVAAIIAFFDL